MTAALWLVAGVLCGAAHFTLLWCGTRRFAIGGAVLPAIGCGLLRLLATTLLLGFAALHGALPLLLAAAGVVIARSLVLRVTEARA